MTRDVSADCSIPTSTGSTRTFTRPRPLPNARSINALFLSFCASGGERYRDALGVPTVALGRSRRLASLDSGAPLLLERLVQALRHLPECVRGLTQLFILVLQLFDFFLAFLQRV